MKQMFWARVKKRAPSWGMFPDNWSANRVKYEVDMAYKNRVEFVEKGKTMWKGLTPSGVEVKGYKEPKTTVYPVMGDK
jgi:putative uncharacterized protein (fragment)